MVKEMQTEIELSISTLTQNAGEIKGWIQEAVDEQRKLMLKRSRVLSAGGDPFLRGAAAQDGSDDVLGPNSFIRIKKSQLDHLLASLNSNQSELESLKQKVETRKVANQNLFIAMNKSLVYKHDYQKDKPFALSLH